jgi:enterochelin esterase-like enzyme
MLWVLLGFVTRAEIDPAKLPAYHSSLPAGDYAIRPPYADAPELTFRSDVPHGKTYSFVMNSEDSQIYPGISKTKVGTVPYKRSVTVYVPAEPIPGLPFLISQDSMGKGELPTILDNMIADHRLPKMAAIMIDSGGSDSKWSERGLEYDTMSGLYAEFVEAEVLPRVEKTCSITLTKDPNKRMTMGGSSGGACAMSMAWYHPDLYRRVLTYSGTYVNQQAPYNPETRNGAWEYHQHLIPNTPRKPLRLWLEVGENDFRNKDPESTFHNWVMANERMAQVLRAKGYPYQFVFAYGANHVDGRVVRQTLPSALEWVWR